MSITAAQLLTYVNSKLHRSETDIDDEIKEVFHDLAEENLLVTEEEDQTAIANAGATIAKPTNFKQLISLRLNDGTTLGPALRPLPGGMVEYGILKDGETSADYDEPEWYVEHGSNFYLYPTSDGAYTPKMSYYRYHDDTTTNPFGTDFDRAVKYGVCLYVALAKRMTSQALLYGQRYAQAKQQKIDSANYDAVIVV